MVVQQVCHAYVCYFGWVLDREVDRYDCLVLSNENEYQEVSIMIS